MSWKLFFLRFLRRKYFALKITFFKVRLDLFCCSKFCLQLSNRCSGLISDCSGLKQIFYVSTCALNKLFSWKKTICFEGSFQNIVLHLLAPRFFYVNIFPTGLSQKIVESSLWINGQVFISRKKHNPSCHGSKRKVLNSPEPCLELANKSVFVQTPQCTESITHNAP